mmetsp:Transcript_3074/g.9559  ORF Transcript_3074/g.9559 Transcript_3074/m.9559 type:complete len:221 (+) Transcript_3074:964-1626(+)
MISALTLWMCRIRSTYSTASWFAMRKASWFLCMGGGGWGAGRGGGCALTAGCWRLSTRTLPSSLSSSSPESLESEKTTGTKTLPGLVVLATVFEAMTPFFLEGLRWCDCCKAPPSPAGTATSGGLSPSSLSSRGVSEAELGRCVGSSEAVAGACVASRRFALCGLCSHSNPSRPTRTRMTSRLRDFGLELSPEALSWPRGLASRFRFSPCRVAESRLCDR